MYTIAFQQNCAIAQKHKEKPTILNSYSNDTDYDVYDIEICGTF